MEGDDRGELVAGLRGLTDAASDTALDTTGPPTIHRLAKDWWEGHPSRPEAPLAIALIARDPGELSALAQTAVGQLEREEDPSDKGAGRVFFSGDPLGPKGELAFVYPGSGSQYAGMGRELCLQWPEILRTQDRANERLRSQLKTAEIWGGGSDIGGAQTVILSQVALGTIATDLMASFDVRPAAVLGYSLGETAGLFSMGAWHERDEMLRRVTDSELFVSDLAGRCNAARKSWGVAEDGELEWLVGVVETAADRAREVIAELDRVYLLIINTPDECVIGGERSAVQKAVELLGCPFHALEGVPTVHCEVANEVAEEYRALHVLDTRAPDSTRFYSGSWGEAYEVNQDRAADSLLAQAIHGVDFPKTVRQAYDDGVRIFLEMGPGGSCTRMIQKILDGVPFRARSISSSTQDEPSAVLRALAMLVAERVAVDLARLYPQARLIEDESGPVTRIPVGQEGFGPLPLASYAAGMGGVAENGWPTVDAGAVPARRAVPAGLAEAVRAAENTIQAHETFLQAAQRTQELAEREYARQQDLIRALTGGAIAASALPDTAAPPSARTLAMDHDQLMEFAVGSIGRALGERFAHVDEHPTRVRLPDEPLMLVDRVTSIEGEPQSMTSGRIVTEHDVLEDGWYLDGGRLPTCIAVEAGQADLLLSGYLGIDSETRGLAVYRLLDAVVTFHSELPHAGQVIQYDIRILRFFRQGDTWLFRFQFDSTVNGRPLLTMREGTAGFFTQGELDAGKGARVALLRAKKKPPRFVVAMWSRQLSS